MSELEKALAAVGESAPERPILEPIEGGDECDEVNSFANRLGLHVTALESLALRLAVRLERAEKSCPVCDARMRRLCGKGSASPEEVSTCHLYEGHEGPCEFSTWRWMTGTGKEQGR